MELGKKIKALRLQNGLTLEELAARSELTKGFLSQLERDLTSPSVSTLEDILEALGTNLSDFFHEAEPEQLVFGKEDYFVNEQDGRTVTWIVPNAQKNAMEPILLKLQPQCCSETIPAFKGEEFGYVLQGTIQICTENQTLTVRSHETFYFSASRSHYLRNSGKREAKVLWVTNPPMF
ncbi:MAG: helix-turn-helix domain-containing protein [Catenisphaera adipataccumulans]|jgi:transcriptional regulator with XRE-family HTH domain|uniref:helix-turn-helix domain-containing protein n=1 Tax=Catenisphaera adipataccumulans TaxID=700500 RepID=UPI003D8A3153